MWFYEKRQDDLLSFCLYYFSLEEELVVPFPYVLSYSFVIVTNLIDEFVVGTVGLVLVGGKITV